MKRRRSARDFQLSIAGVLLLLLWPLAVRSTGTADVNAIVQRWTEANHRDLEAAPQYSYFERIRDDNGTKTYEVTMLFGSPYKRLVKQNGKPLRDEARQQQEDAFEQTVRERKAELPDQKWREVSKYQRQTNERSRPFRSISARRNLAASGSPKFVGRTTQ